MNGISSNLKDELKKTNESKQKTKIRFFGAIIISNVLVALLCLPSQEPVKEKLNPSNKTLHINYQIMVLPLNLLISSEDQKLAETPVTLISVDKKVLIKKAYLHGEIQKEKSDDNLFEGSLRHFKIEIPQHDLLHVSDLLEKGVIAIPYVEIQVSKIKNQGSKYEVSF